MKILINKTKENSLYWYPYQIIKNDLFPDKDLVTAVFMLALFDSKIFLTKNHRWWELPWGHIEYNETFLETLSREVLEEVGTNIKNSKYWWYQKIILEKPITKKDWWYYPFPNWYILYFTWTSTWEIFPTSWLETISSWLFSLNEALNIIENKDTKDIMKLLYNP